MSRVSALAALSVVAFMSGVQAQAPTATPNTPPVAAVSPASLEDCTNTADRAKAIVACSAVIKDAGKDGKKLAAAYAGKAAAERANGALRDAFKDYSSALAYDAVNPGIWAKRGEVRSALGQNFRSTVDYSVALRYDPKNVPALLGRSEQYRKLGILPKAIEDADAVIKLDPKSAVAFAFRAYAQQREGHDAEAAKDAEQALALDPKSALAYAARGFTKIKSDKQGALDDLKKALQLDPNLEAVNVALKRLAN